MFLINHRALKKISQRYDELRYLQQIITRPIFASRSHGSSGSEAIITADVVFLCEIGIVRVSLLLVKWYDSWMAKRAHGDKDDGWRWVWITMHLFVYVKFLYVCVGEEASYFRANVWETRTKTRGIYLDLLIAIRILLSVRSESFLCGAETKNKICSANNSLGSLQVRARMEYDAICIYAGTLPLR